MAIPSSGPLSLNDIKGEFGGPASPSLGDYYAGGSYVPAGTTGTYGAVPSSGTISIRNFYGTSNVVISITDQSIFDLDASDAYAYYFLTSGGQVASSTQAGGTSPTTLEQWCTPTSQASNYEARVTVTTGTLSGGSGTGTWLALSSTRNWFVNAKDAQVIKGNQF
jgi:hypothetical protein